MYGHVIIKFLKWVDLLSYGAPPTRARGASLVSCCFLYSKSNLYVATQPRPQGLSLKKWVGREKALASAGHVSPRTP